jgi:hypothetical protein
MPSSGHAVPAVDFASAGQLLLAPSHDSAGSQTPVDARHCVESFASPGHTLDEPVQVSAGSQTPPLARHTEPAWPAACWHASAAPSQRSVVHTLPSSVQAVPLAVFESAGQPLPTPSQYSAGSHSPADPRQSELSFASKGHTADDPVQVSAGSQAPPDARHVAPTLPAGCWQAAEEPLHVSVVQGLPSSGHAVPLP